MEKTSVNVFEVKVIRQDIGFKISAADVMNEYLYLGDEKGYIHSYPIRIGEFDVIPKGENENSRGLCKSKIDKILCYKEISMILIMASETLFAIDSGFKKSESLVTKITDFAINESFGGGLGTYSVVAIGKKKEASIFVYDPAQKKFVDAKSNFTVSEIPNSIAFTDKFVVLALKRDYESFNVNKNFERKKNNAIECRFPFVRAIDEEEILFFTDECGLFMSPEFEQKNKGSITNSRPIQQISLAGNYCFILCDTVLQIYSNYNKKVSFVQEIPMNSAKGITNHKPFLYNREDLYFLYEIPYETQIKGLIDRCRVEDAISLLIQKTGAENEQKVEELKIEAIWPLLKKMLFEKAKDLAKAPSFDVRELIHLFPELISVDMSSMEGFKAEKTMITLIIEFVNEKSQKKYEELIRELKEKSKMALRDILLAKREAYLSQGAGKLKKVFFKAKNTLIKGELPLVTCDELLEIIDFTLIKYFLDSVKHDEFEAFLLANPQIYCQKYFHEFDEALRRTGNILTIPSLRPRIFAAFKKNDEAIGFWQSVAEESQSESVIKTACEEAVNLLAKLEDKLDNEEKLDWIFKLRPQIAMKYFTLVPLNLLQSDKIIKRFEKQKNEQLLELFLETIVTDKGTEIEQYHTKLMLIYLNGLFSLHSKESKEESKNPEFLLKLAKFRTLLKDSNSKFASEPILKKIDKCEWLLEDEIELYGREKRHEEALRRFINKDMSEAAVKYCLKNGEQTLTVYFKMLILKYKSYEASQNNTALFLKKDIITFLSEHGTNPQLDHLIVLEQIPDDWMLSESDSTIGIHQFLESAITHTLHMQHSVRTARYVSEMDLLNSEFKLMNAKKANLKFTTLKKCCICNHNIADKFFLVYPNANVCHQACAKKEKNTVCPITGEDFEKTFKY